MRGRDRGAPLLLCLSEIVLILKRNALLKYCAGSVLYRKGSRARRTRGQGSSEILEHLSPPLMMSKAN